MSDDRNDGEIIIDPDWGDIPMSARKAVYETLREAAARYERDLAVARLMRSATGGDSSAPSPTEKVMQTLGAAHMTALILLINIDPDYCDNCGEPHPPEDPTLHKRKQELS